MSAYEAHFVRMLVFAHSLAPAFSLTVALKLPAIEFLFGVLLILELPVAIDIKYWVIPLKDVNCHIFFLLRYERACNLKKTEITSAVILYMLSFVPLHVS